MVGLASIESIGEGIGVSKRVESRAQPFRAVRYPAGEFGLGPILASFHHPRLHSTHAECENLSLHGMLLRLPSSSLGGELPGIGDSLTGLHVILSTGEVLFHGAAVVRQVRVQGDGNGDDLLLGLSLLDGVVDLSLLHRQQTRSRFSVRCDEAEHVAAGARILPAFKEWLADLRFYLENMQAFLDKEEAALSGEDLFTREAVRAQYVAEIGPRVVRRVHQASHAMGPLLGGLTEEEHARHRPYAQHHLGGLFRTSPLMRRALNKPLGYAGDYEMMNMLYSPAEEGSSLFGQIVNLCAVQEVAARAIVNRVGYLGDKLRAAIARRGAGADTGRTQVASIGSGPAREVEALLSQEPEQGALLDVMLVDQDPRAISYCERKLGPLARSSGARLHLVRGSVRRLLTGGSVAPTGGRRDLIYSAGLFDYLSDRSFSALLSALYEALAPGGSLVIGNVSMDNPTRYFMEYFLEWFLVHRSPAQLRDQARMLRPAPRSVRVESEPLGVNLFLIIER